MLKPLKTLFDWYVNQPVLLLITAVLCWGANTIFGQLAVNQVTPVMVVFLRWAIVSALLWPLFGHRVKADWPLIKPRLGMTILMASLGFTAFNSLFYAAAHTTTAINVGILQGSMPIFVLVGSYLVFSTRVTRLQLLGSLIGLAGVIAVATKGNPLAILELDISLGDGLMLFACLLYSFYTLALKNRPAISGVSFFTLMAPIAMVTAIPLLVADIVANGFVAPTLQGWLVTFGIALLPSCLAQLTFLRGVDLIGPGPAGVYMNLTPVFAAAMSVTFLGEQFYGFHAAGLAMVIGGIWLVQRQASGPVPRAASNRV